MPLFTRCQERFPGMLPGVVSRKCDFINCQPTRVSQKETRPHNLLSVWGFRKMHWSLEPSLEPWSEPWSEPWVEPWWCCRRMSSCIPRMGCENHNTDLPSSFFPSCKQWLRLPSGGRLRSRRDMATFQRRNGRHHLYSQRRPGQYQMPTQQFSNSNCCRHCGNKQGLRPRPAHSSPIHIHTEIYWH
jgi:hypothetical protein